MRYLVIANPATRRSSPRIVERLKLACPPDIELDVHTTLGPRLARVLVEQHLPGVSAVVVIGGDGTVGEVASVLVGTDVPLAIIPAGSTNIIAQELGIPTNVRSAVRFVFSPWTARKIDVGRVGEHYFLHMAGAGVDSRMFTLANPRMKRLIGWLAYLPAGGKALFEAPARFTLEIDGQTKSVVSPLVLIANGGSVISPRLKLMQRLQADDGVLDVLIFRATSVRPAMMTLLDMFRRRLDRSIHVEHHAARTLTLSSDPPLPVELDGDVVTTTPVTIEIRPSALYVIAPVIQPSRKSRRR